MELGKLDHVNIRTSNLDALTSWYQSILGMKSAYRPPFPFPGAWLYVGEDAAVHLIGIESGPTVGDDLQLEHFAFKASGLDEFRNHLDRNAVKFEEVAVPGIDVTQLNMWDPDGNHIHIDFDTSSPHP